jgi:hypothetical protein
MDDKNGNDDNENQAEIDQKMDEKHGRRAGTYIQQESHTIYSLLHKKHLKASNMKKRFELYAQAGEGVDAVMSVVDKLMQPLYRCRKHKEWHPYCIDNTKLTTSEDKEEGSMSFYLMFFKETSCEKINGQKDGKCCCMRKQQLYI